MKESVKEFWQLLKSQTGWDRMTIKQKCITIWWCLSFCAMISVFGKTIVTVIILVNLALSSYCLIKYVPEPKD